MVTQNWDIFTMLKFSKFWEDLLHGKGKIALGIVLPKISENSELSPWPRLFVPCSTGGVLFSPLLPLFLLILDMNASVQNLTPGNLI